MDAPVSTRMSRSCRSGTRRPSGCQSGERTPADLATLRYRGQDTPILSYAEFLGLVAGRVPLLVEITMKEAGRNALR